MNKLGKYLLFVAAVMICAVGVLVHRVVQQNKVIKGYALAHQALAIAVHKYISGVTEAEYSLSWVQAMTDPDVQQAGNLNPGIEMFPVFADPLHYGVVSNTHYMAVLWDFVRKYNYITLGDAIAALRDGHDSNEVESILLTAESLYSGSYESELHSQIGKYLAGDAYASNLFEQVYHYATVGRGLLLDWYKGSGEQVRQIQELNDDR